MNRTGARVAINRRWVAVGMIVGLCALGVAGAVEVRVSPAVAAPSGVTPVAYVGTSGGTGIGAFRTNALSTEAGLIGFGGPNPPVVSAVAITPSDSAVVAIAGTTMAITPLPAPSYIAPSQSAPVTVTINQVPGVTQPPSPASGLAISSDGKFAYTIIGFDSDPSVVARVDLGTHAVTFLPFGQSQGSDFDTLAVSPDGQALFLGGSIACDGTCAGVVAIPAAGGAPSGQWVGPTCPESTVNCVNAIAVTPDGSELYAVGSFGTEAIGTVPASGRVLTGAAVTSDVADAQAVAITPDGQRVYVGGRGIGLSTFPVTAVGNAQPTGTRVVVPDEAERSGISALAILPDSSEVIATAQDTANSELPSLVTVPLASDLPHPANVQGVDHPGPAGQTYASIAITPDLAPNAHLASSPSQPTPGQTVTIDTAGSSVAFGTIPTDGYQWSASGGTCAPFIGPSLHCTFGAGTFTITVRETDSAGTSTVAALHPGVDGVDFTGRTASRVASNVAATSLQVTVLPAGTVPATSTPPTTPTSPTSPTPPTSPTTPTSPTAPGQPAAGTPTLTLNPGVGPPGTIVTVTGTGFTPNAPVTVAWSTSTGSVVIVADAQGDLPPTQLDILTPDVLGPRDAVASSTPPTSAPFLVVPSDSEPGGGSGDFLFRSEGP